MHFDNFYDSKYSETHGLAPLDINYNNDYTGRQLDLNEELIRNKPATFFMRVNSDALNESGIYKGDIIVVDRSLKAVSGKIIIAILNGEMLLRRFEKNNKNVRLLADSNKLAPINIDATCGEFAVWGVVTYVIHKP